MPSWRGMGFSAFGANQRELSHCFTSPCACCFTIFAGSTASGASSGSAAFACATIADPQNGQTPATSGGWNVTELPHAAQCTSSACGAICVNCPSCAFARNSSSGWQSRCPGAGEATAEVVCFVTGAALAGTAAVVPQNGHFIIPEAGSNFMSAEQPGQGKCAFFGSPELPGVVAIKPPLQKSH